MALVELPEIDRGSFDAPEFTPAYDHLMQLTPDELQSEITLYPNPSYEEYLALHKVVLESNAAPYLEGIYHDLKDESMPRYLSAGGWAAAEAALIGEESDVAARLRLLDGAVECWARAIDTQKQFNASEVEFLREDSYPYRIALDVAIVPLLRSFIQNGDVPLDVRWAVFEDCLNIAQANAVRIDLMLKEGDVAGLADHSGFGYECNALLAFNLRCTKGWFAMPSSARSDTGYHHREQTHDLSIVHLKEGQLKTITPIEIKSTTNTKDRARYWALLVRGKMHLSVPGLYRPSHTLTALEAVYEGRATNHERKIVSEVSERMLGMVRDYNAGTELGHVATRQTVTRFHDIAEVVRNHPGWPNVS